MEIRVDVSGGVEDIHDLDHIGKISKENDVALEWNAAYIRPQFRPGATKLHPKRGQLGTLLLDLLGKASGNRHMPAFLCDVSLDIQKILVCRRQVDKLTHSEASFRQVRRLGFERRGHVFIGEPPTGRDRAV